MQPDTLIDPSETNLETLLLAQVRDKTPIIHHLPGDDVDQDLATEAIKVELYRDAYAIYFREPGYRSFFDFRTTNYMALISFSDGKMQMNIKFKPWRRNGLYMAGVFGTLIWIFMAFITQSWGFPWLFLILLAALSLMLGLEKDRFHKRVKKYLRALRSGEVPYFT